MKNKPILLALTILVLSQKSYSTSIIALTSDFDHDFSKNSKRKIREIYKDINTNDVIFISASDGTEYCHITRKNVSFKTAYKKCNLRKYFKYNKNGENTINPQRLIDRLASSYNIEKNSSIYLFGSPLYISKEYNINFNYGFPSLGYISESKNKNTKNTSPFYKRYSKYNLTNIRVHFIHPDNINQNYIQLKGKDIGIHRARIESFWLYFFKSFNMDLYTYSSYKSKLSIRFREENISNSYEESKDKIFFHDLYRLSNIKSPMSGQEEVIVSDYKKSGIKKGETFQWNMSSLGQIRKILIRETDADSDSHSNIIEIYGLNKDGDSIYIDKFVPSKNNAEKITEINVTSNSLFQSIYLKPVSKGGFDNLNGYWLINEIKVTYR